MNILESFSDFLWPRCCRLCGRPSDRDGRHLCSACLERLPFITQFGCCRICGRAGDPAGGEYLCGDCLDQPRYFDRAASALDYAGLGSELLTEFKFRGGLYLRADLVDFLEAAAEARVALDKVDLVVPVPLALPRRLNRGYNQSAVLAKEFARRRKLKYAEVLSRRWLSPKQSSLDEAARRENVRNLFRVRRPAAVAARSVLVIDDVMTTGATLDEIARLLKGAGARHVLAVTLCRTLRD